MRKGLLLLGLSALTAGCGLLEAAFGEVQVAVRGPVPLEEVRYRATSLGEGALLREGTAPLVEGAARFGVPAPQGGVRVVLEGRYGGFTFYQAEATAPGPLDYPVEVLLDEAARTRVSPTLVFANLPSDGSGDQVVVCLRQPIFAPNLGSPYCSPGFAAVAARGGGASLSLESLPEGPLYEVLYITPTRVYRASWASPRAATWSFDLNTMAWEAR